MQTVKQFLQPTLLQRRRAIGKAAAKRPLSQEDQQNSRQYVYKRTRKSMKTFKKQTGIRGVELIDVAVNHLKESMKCQPDPKLFLERLIRQHLSA